MSTPCCVRDDGGTRGRGPNSALSRCRACSPAGLEGPLQQPAEVVQRLAHSIGDALACPAGVGGPQNVSDTLQRVAAGPQVHLPAFAREMGHVIRVEPPSSQVNKAAHQHGCQVAETPPVLGKVQQAAQPHPKRASVETLSGGRVQRQVVLVEHLPGEGQVRRYLPKCDGAVGWAQPRIVRESLLDLPGYGSELLLPVRCRVGDCRGRRTRLVTVQLNEAGMRKPGE